MQNVILFAIAIFGAILIINKSILLEYIPSTINDKLNIVYNNSTVVGGILIFLSYYLYTIDMQKQSVTPVTQFPSFEPTSDLTSL
jgi:uncharacterized membrane-anchored protein